MTQAAAHGNSLLSNKTQSLYRIINSKTGQVYKYGVSGGRVTKSGIPYRASSQVNKLNHSAGSPIYKAETLTTRPNRGQILQLERDMTEQYIKEFGRRPPGMLRP